MQKAAFVDVLQPLGHIEDDLRDVLGEHRIVRRVEFFQVRTFQIFHEAIHLPVDLPVFEIADDRRMALHAGENLAAALEALARRAVAGEVRQHQPQRVGAIVAVGGEPDVRHAAARDELLQSEPPELAGASPHGRIALSKQTEHAKSLAGARADCHCGVSLPPRRRSRPRPRFWEGVRRRERRRRGGSGCRTPISRFPLSAFPPPPLPCAHT